MEIAKNWQACSVTLAHSLAAYPERRTRSVGLRVRVMVNLVPVHLQLGFGGKDLLAFPFLNPRSPAMNASS
ncbi:hypothetical protein KQ715_15900, partial [Listeria monocytogenes]|nr:hypothetical protein [Listeria monocytogenes]